MKKLERMNWSKNIPHKSGWYWVKHDKEAAPEVYHIEGRTECDDGWVWLPGGDRFYLTPGVRSECGDGLQSEIWMTWEWAGPITPPR